VVLLKTRVFWCVTPGVLVNSCRCFEELDAFFCRAKQKLLRRLDTTFFRKFSNNSVRQKYLTILQNSSDWNRWRGEFALVAKLKAFQLPWSAGL
jgi:hypothetical protein